jgi:hypothetical protein
VGDIMAKITFESIFESVIDDESLISVQGDSFYNADGEIDADKLNVCYELIAGKVNLSEEEKNNINNIISLVIVCYDENDNLACSVDIAPAPFEKDVLIDNFLNGIEFLRDDLNLILEDFADYYKDSRIYGNVQSKKEIISIHKIVRTYSLKKELDEVKN